MSSLRDRTYCVLMPQHRERLGEVSEALLAAGIFISAQIEKRFPPRDLKELQGELPRVLVEIPEEGIEERPFVRFNLEGENLGTKLYNLRSRVMSGSLRQSSPNDPQSTQFRDVCWWPANDADFKKFANFFRA